MIGIIGALDIELNFFFEKMIIAKTELIGDKTFYLGKINNQEVVIVKSDIGKVNAAIAATVLASHYHVKMLINTGIAGGIEPCKLGDIVLGQGLAYFDASLTAIDDLPYGKMGDDPLIVYSDSKYLEIAKDIFDNLGYNYLVGNIVSGDKFVTKLRYLDKISKNVDNILACEMEGMAIAITAHKFNIPFISVRGISDMVENNSQTFSYQKVSKEVARKSSNFVISFLEKLNEAY